MGTTVTSIKGFVDGARLDINLRYSGSLRQWSASLGGLDGTEE